MTNERERCIQLTDVGTERLAIAIVKQAADDYERVLRKMLRKPSAGEMKKLKIEKASHESFFLSPWCEVLLNLTDGRKLMMQIQKNAVSKEKERVEKKLKKAKEQLTEKVRKGA